MAASKKKKIIRQDFSPDNRVVKQHENPEAYYDLQPAWNFSACDLEGTWAFTKEKVGEFLWDEIIPRLQGWETQTWSEILITAKKQNHNINVSDLNDCARDRLAEKYIEKEAIISLRLQGTHRLYGYIIGSVFYILWYDMDHGDSKTCVCRSAKKHT